jgi:hypothetical protein
VFVRSWHANGTFTHGAERDKCPPISTGDIVSVQIDSNEGVINFHKNGSMICQYRNLLQAGCMSPTAPNSGVRPYISFGKRRDSVVFLGNKTGPVKINFGTNDPTTKTYFEGFVKDGAFDGAGIQLYLTPGHWRGNWSHGKQHGIQLWVQAKQSPAQTQAEPASLFGSSRVPESEAPLQSEPATLKVTAYLFKCGEQVRELPGSKEAWLHGLQLTEADLLRVHAVEPAEGTAGSTAAIAAAKALDGLSSAPRAASSGGDSVGDALSDLFSMTEEDTAVSGTKNTKESEPSSKSGDDSKESAAKTATKPFASPVPTPYQQWATAEKNRIGEVSRRIKLIRTYSAGEESSGSNTGNTPPPLPNPSPGLGPRNADLALGPAAEEYEDVVVGTVKTNPRYLFLLQSPKGGPQLNAEFTTATNNSGSGGRSMVHGSRGFSSGIHYWEVKLDLSRINHNYKYVDLYCLFICQSGCDY